MNDYEDQLLGTLPELTQSRRLNLHKSKCLDANLEQLQPEVEQPEVSPAAATAAPVEAPPQQKDRTELDSF